MLAPGADGFVQWIANGAGGDLISQRMQIVATTHSADLIIARAERPESVIVCENSLGTGTSMKRLDPERLKVWLEKYSLGELWSMGEIGGTRW